MREGETQLEGSRAIAQTVAGCRPQVIAAYPISPQTHIVEALSALVASGELAPCEFVNVESEFAALSACIGASAAGARAYTATAGQGLLYMAEALYNASGLAMPIVMTVANRAVGAPINIWNDHSDALSQRDCGWVQLYARSIQDAIDLHPQAFRLAEELCIPVMVCVDGYVLTHAVERVTLLPQEEIDAFLPPFSPRQLLQPSEPITIGAMVGPDAFTEVRYLAHLKQMQALDRITQIAAAFEQRFGRAAGGLLHHYRSHDASTIIVALGSVIGTVEEAVDELRDAGRAVGCVGIGAVRPWPATELREALIHATRVIVLERAVSVGAGGVISADIRAAAPGATVHTAIAGLGGRPITRADIHQLADDAERGVLESLRFVGLRHELIDRELERMLATRRSGPHAENMLRDLIGHGRETPA